MDLQLDGQVAVVVGGAQGLGRAIAAEFVAERAAVVLIDKSPTAHATAAALGTPPDARLRAIIADATDPQAITSAARQVLDEFGRCDHVVYAAAIGSGKIGFPFWNVAPADWEPVLRVNLIGAVNIAQAFAPRMAEARRGTLLFLASVAGQIGSQTDPPYSASKAGLINFAQCAARDMAPYGVRVNTLCPGMVNTALSRAVYEAWAARQPADQRGTYAEWAEEKTRRVVPLNRWQEPDEIAAMAVFLASPRARGITGQTINVDGGYVMHW